MISSTIKAQLWFCLLFVLFCIDFYSVQFFQPPYGIHEWSNTERLSLAYGFYDDGMNFFRPSTFNQESINGIVGHEFPLQSYLAALLAKVFGRESITMNFRLINLSLFFCGLLSLFTIVFTRTKSFLFSLITPVFFISSPMFVDYAGGFLPDPASASIIFIGFYFLMRFIEHPVRRNLFFSILSLTLATLLKTSSIIYLSATLLFIFLHFVKHSQSKTKSEWLVFFTLAAFSAACVLGFYLHNDYLNTHYHATLFPTKPMPFKDWEDVSRYFSYSFKHYWMDNYFTLPAYLFFILVFSACLPVLAKEARYKRHSLLSILFFIFLIPVFYIMGNQLHVHDYYIICMFFPLLAWLMLTSVIILHSKMGKSPDFKMIRVSLIFTLLLLYCFANFSAYKRMNMEEPRIKDFTRTFWMRNGSEIMDKLKVPQTDRILILNEMPPNQGLLFFNRKGYVFYSDRWNDTSAVNIIQMMKEKKLSIAVCDTKRVFATENINPQFYEGFETLYRDEKATVFRLK